MENNRYLCFNLGKEEFAIPLLDVKEVIGPPETTPVPQAPAHFLGIMNLRGQVLSILDLRLRLSIKPTTSEETAVIILDLGEFQMGVMVDRINSVLVFNKEDIAERPSMEGAKSQDAIMGVVRRESSLILLLNVYKALSIDDRTAAKSSQVKQAA